MTASSVDDAHWIADEATLQSWVDKLEGESSIAVDLEANSMHAYFERICLIQVSAAGEDLLIDPLAVNIKPLLGLLANPKIEKILHGSDYDVLSLKREYEAGISNLFDTMIAGRVLGWPRYGLAAILKEMYGHDSNKAFQRYDWGRRPLDPAALAYARYDTHFLAQLREAQWEQLVERDRVEHFRRACRRQEQAEPRVKTFEADDFWKLKATKEVDPAGLAVLRDLFVWRDGVARQQDRPPFRVMPELAMVGIAKQRPRDVAALTRIKGFPKGGARTMASALVDLVGAARDAPVPVAPSRSPKPAREVTTRFDALRGWRKAAAEALGVEPDVVIDKATLQRLAESHPQDEAGLLATGELDAWEVERYGGGILEALGQA